MRSAGCIINDIIDQDFDAKVERTKIRPLAAKSLNNFQACLALLFFLIIGFIVWLFLSKNAKYASIFSAFLMVIYPYMKRFTNWPQLVLGFAFNSGLIVAILHTGTFTWDILILFASLVLWTIFYDTIYAFADIKDDIKIGVKSTAVVMQNAPKFWLTVCNILIHALLGIYFKCKLMFFIPSGFIYLQALLIKWDITDPQNCIKTFGNCHIWGLALWLWGELLIRIISP